MSSILSDIHSNERAVPKGRYVFHQGDAIHDMFEILSGEVQLIRRQSQGQKLIVQRGQPGSILAEASLLTDRYHCDAVAAEATTVKCFRRIDVLARFESDHSFAKLWATHLANEVRSARLKAEVLSQRTVAQRLDMWLLQNKSLPAKGRWKLLAAEIATTPEALYREISRRL